jgi:S1/P1 Nuclease
VKSGQPAPESKAPVNLVSGIHPLRSAAIVAFLAFASFLLAPSTAWAWGCQGHQIVALIAERNLTPHALAMVKQILTDSPIDPSLDRYCKEGGADPLADASTWPDDVRPFRPETAPWHYIGIPPGASRGDLAKFCPLPESCVTQAIRDQLALLGDAGRAQGMDPLKKAEALRFLIHFVGDIHQPMHGMSNNDQGGNCVPVAFFDNLPKLRNPQTDSYAPNLHSVWDTDIVATLSNGKTADEVAAELNQTFQSQIAGWKQTKADVDEWAWESHQAAEKTAYGKLPVPIPFESPQPIKSCADDNRIAQRMLKLDEHLAQPYQDVAAPLVRQRLAIAGARLAMLLNQLWP